MAAMTAVTVSVPAFAESSIVNVPSTNEVLVQSSIASNFTVTIPKAVVLTKASGSGTGEYTAAFDATVTGDIGELETVYVTPDASVTLTGDKAGATTVATTTIGTTEFARAAILGQTATGTHNLTAQLTPGAWSGAMNVAITLKAATPLPSYDKTDAWRNYYTVTQIGTTQTAKLGITSLFKAALEYQVPWEGYKPGEALPAIPESVNGLLITSTEGMFFQSTAKSLDLSKWNLTNITNAAGMFAQMKSVTNIDITNCNLVNVIDMTSMFAGNISLTSMDLSRVDVKNVTSINSLFIGCTNLRSVNVKGWNTSRISNMGQPFMGCISLQTLDLQGWDTASATTYANMFNACAALTDINVTSNLWTISDSPEATIFAAAPNAHFVFKA